MILTAPAPDTDLSIYTPFLDSCKGTPGVYFGTKL